MKNAKEFLEELMKNNPGDSFNIDYGHPEGRIESYSLDKEDISGYDSSGGFQIIPLEELEIEFIQSVQVCKTIFKK